MKRAVQFKEEEITFAITCDKCPLKPHLEALGQPPRACVSGIMTNMQGPVPVASCEHYKKDSISNDADKSLMLECGKEDA